MPFVADPAVPKHLGYFLRRHRAEAIEPEGHHPEDRPARPDAILFNGGALTPNVVRGRIVDVISSWFEDDPEANYTPRVLTNPSLDLAVAGGRVLRSGPPGRRDPDRRRDRAIVLRRVRDVGDGSSLALRRSPCCPGRRRDRDHGP